MEPPVGSHCSRRYHPLPVTPPLASPGGPRCSVAGSIALPGARIGFTASGAAARVCVAASARACVAASERCSVAGSNPPSPAPASDSPPPVLPSAPASLLPGVRGRPCVLQLRQAGWVRNGGSARSVPVPLLVVMLYQSHVLETGPVEAAHVPGMQPGYSCLGCRPQQAGRGRVIVQRAVTDPVLAARTHGATPFRTYGAVRSNCLYFCPEIELPVFESRWSSCRSQRSCSRGHPEDSRPVN